MTATLTQVDILGSLRAASGALHEALDARLPIARDDASLQDYLNHLRGLRPWLGEIRTVLAASGVPALEQAAWRIDARLRALDLDLEDAAAPGRPDDAPATAAPLPREAALDAGFAWGRAYVVEGSQLGGAVMHRRLGERLAPHPLRYFRPIAGGETLAGRWREFVAQLGHALASPAEVAAAQRGAVAAFERLMERFGLNAPAKVVSSR
jgi:heme oxygenase